MRSQAFIDLDRIRHNTRVLRAFTAVGTRQMAVVKADGYGHGAVPVARAALAAGATWLAVATIDEGTALRVAGLTAPILILSPIEPTDAAVVLTHDLTPTLSDPEGAEALAASALSAGRPVRVHIKVDTGMGRLGFYPRDVVPFFERLEALPNVVVEGLFSHFATADEPDPTFAHLQLGRFREVISALGARGIRPALVHMANTAATLALPESHFDLVRNGIGIYGLPPSPAQAGLADLRPALTWTARIGHLKDVPTGTPLSYGCTHVTAEPRRLATVTVGYGDGYPRLLSNRGNMVVSGRRAPIVGRVCMDLTLLDITNIPGVRVGDPVTLLGSDGDAVVTADDLAAWTDTINYEITCQVGRRVPRRYREA